MIKLTDDVYVNYNHIESICYFNKSVVVHMSTSGEEESYYNIEDKTLEEVVEEIKKQHKANERK